MADDSRRKDPRRSEKERKDIARTNATLELFADSKRGLQRAGDTAELQRLAAELVEEPGTTDEALDLVASEIIAPGDIAYTHSLFLQCFMPLRHNLTNQRQWKTGNGNVKLLIRAGLIVNPESDDFKECIVPAGPKARLILAYINDYAFREKSPVIDLGESLRKFMKAADVPIGGKNGKELTRELENIYAADIYMGVWGATSAHQDQIKIGRRMSFWLEKTPEQRSFWQPTMTLSEGYFASLLEGGHIAPLHWPGYIALQHNARAMDIFAFLVYRLRKPLKRPVLLHAKVLHAMFGGSKGLLKHFWPEFKIALMEALKQYPTARIEILKDAIKLYDSPALIPYRKMPLIPGL